MTLDDLILDIGGLYEDLTEDAVRKRPYLRADARTEIPDDLVVLLQAELGGVWSMLVPLIEGMQPDVRLAATGRIPQTFMRMCEAFEQSALLLRQVGSRRVRCWAAMFLLDRLRCRFQELIAPDGRPCSPFRICTRCMAALPRIEQGCREGQVFVPFMDEPMDLRDQRIENVIRERATERVYAIIENVEAWWNGAETGRWAFPDASRSGSVGSVAAFPVSYSGKAGSGGGLCYVTAVPRGAGANWAALGFSRELDFEHQLNALCRLAIALVADIPPERVHVSEIQAMRPLFQFVLLYGGEVTSGRSHTGAMLVLLTLLYIYHRMGSEALNLVRWSPVAISVEIDTNALTLLPVGGLQDKLRAVAETWGSGCRCVLPAANRPDVEATGTSLCEPVFVTTPLGLVESVLGPLAQARREWLASLKPAEFNAYWRSNLSPALVRDWESLRQDGAMGSGGVVRFDESGLLAGLYRHDGHALVRMGFSDAAVAPVAETVRTRALVLVCGATDGDAFPDDATFWASARKGGTFVHMTQVIHQILKGTFSDANREQENTTVYVHVLGHAEPVMEPITREHRPDAAAINESLLRVRRDLHLERRGHFIRPVFDHWLHGEPPRHRRYDALEIAILSNAEIPDLADSATDGRLPGVLACVRVILGVPRFTTSLLPGERDVIVALRDPGETEAGLLAEAFGQASCRMSEAVLRFAPGQMPRGWRSEDSWKLRSRADGASELVLQRTTPCVSAAIAFLLPEADSQRIGVAATVRNERTGEAWSESADEQGFESCGQANWRALKPVAQGCLEPGEIARLQSPSWCADCKQEHLKCDRQQDYGALYHLVFDSVHQAMKRMQFPRGLLAMCRNDGRWCFDAGSLLLDTTGVVLCNGEILLVGPDGVPLRELPLRGDALEYVEQGRTWLIWKL